MNRKISANFSVLFVAGFGPVVQDIAESSKFYLDTLGLSFEKDGDYLHRQIKRRQALRALATFSGRTIMFRRRELAV